MDSMVMMKVPDGRCVFMNERQFKASHGQRGYSFARARDERIAQAMGWVEKPKAAAKKAKPKG